MSSASPPSPRSSRSCCSRSPRSCCCCSASPSRSASSRRPTRSPRSFVLLGVAALGPAGGRPMACIFNGGFIADDFARYMKVLVLVGSAFALLLSISTAKQNGLDKFEYSILVHARDARHDGHGLGQRPHVALCRPRAAVAGALRRRRDQPRQRQGDRSRPQVLRPRRAVVGHAALRRVAGLRLHRPDPARRDHRASSRWATARSG